MAQWTGQFTGRTHDTKVQAVELSLRQAVESFENAPQKERVGKLKAVQKLSKRLLDARLKALRARLFAVTEPGNKSQEARLATHLRTRVQQLEAQGVDGILREFGVYDKPVALP
jgi:ABC-type uncharacterized transport system auxiliary subunit